MKNVLHTKRVRNAQALIFLFFLTTINSSSQEKAITANVEVDRYGNLYVNNTISNLDKQIDTIVANGGILLHKDQALLKGNVKMGKVYYKKYLPKTNDFSFTINLLKEKTDSYRMTKDFFLASISYLVTLKKDFGERRAFNIETKLPEKYTLIYPSKEDLKKAHLYPPPIIAGDFYNSKIEGFDVYNLNRFKESQGKVKDILGVINDAYNFYLQSYPEHNRKPKIIFVPFISKTLLGKTFDNVILLNSKMLKDTARLEKRLLAHEVAHLFWGVTGLRFKESVLTEGIAEYMSLKYLDFKNEDKELKSLLNKKGYRSEGFREASLVSKKIKKEDKKVISYSFSTLLFLYNEKENKSFYTDLSKFYKEKATGNTTVSLDELQEFLMQKELRLIDSNTLPDFFITETDNSLIINGFTINDTKVEVVKELIDGSKEKHSLAFSYKNDTYTFSKTNLKKIIIDPDYKVLQFSRLNDIWHKDETSYSSKNRYFNLIDVNPKVLAISDQLLRYLVTKDNSILKNLICEENVWLTNSYKALKDEIYKDIEGDITITGASTYYREGAKSMSIKMVYFTEGSNTSKLVYLRLYLDEGLNYVQKLKKY
ncbi:hypothetical protein FG167_00510 [Lacinutrix sp. WUR7]|uniref:hypothetical protein n=1 Tax=Lacinutrix sp. WUR7 TaxID=2653681 RepID=UPI00193D1BD7|nr:hypothetical protein [Lacinutrix sp. WUR7]QRM87762.1 hypothetical protein FG167_00510 [Lacinutrix sp. WUR7]